MVKVPPLYLPRAKVAITFAPLGKSCHHFYPPIDKVMALLPY
jgi:hypothetical protein